MDASLSYRPGPGLPLSSAPRFSVGNSAFVPKDDLVAMPGHCRRRPSEDARHQRLLGAVGAGSGRRARGEIHHMPRAGAPGPSSGTRLQVANLANGGIRFASIRTWPWIVGLGRSIHGQPSEALVGRPEIADERRAWRPSESLGQQVALLR